MNHFKHQVVLFSELIILGFISMAFVSFIVDPFCIFHKPFYKKNVFIPAEVFMDLGMIEMFLKKTDDYDTILVGTSHTENYLANEITDTLNSKGTLKLCLSGGHPIELEAIARKAISSGKIKNMVYGFECYGFIVPANTPHQYRIFPYNIYKYPILFLFDKSSLKNSLKYLNLQKFKYYDDLNKLYYYWDEDYIQLAHKNFVSEENLVNLKRDFPDYKNFVDNKKFSDFSAIDSHLLPLIRENPNINFYIQIIPYSWAWFISFDKIEKFLSIIDYLVQSLASFPNVKIYGFHDLKFVGNLRNYYNDSHYQPEVNRYMLYCIKNDLHRITTDNLENYKINMLKNLQSFEIKDRYEKMDTLDDLIEQGR